LPFFGGILITKFGIRKMNIIFAFFILIGQLIFSIGCQYNSMITMLIGRFVFGMGGECIYVTQNAIVIKWFYKSEIALPLGIFLSVSSFGGVLNDIISPMMVSHVYKN